MVTLKKDKQSIQEELSELLNQYYDGSFARMVSEYIRATGITEAEVDALLEEMKHSITFVSWIRVSHAFDENDIVSEDLYKKIMLDK